MMTLRNLPIPFRALFSSFLVLIGIGYLTAVSYMFLVDIEPHVGTQQSVVQDIEEHYHGLPSNTRLEMALNGAMSSMAPAEDKSRIIAWIHDGATRQGYATVAPIFKNNCVTCHNPDNNRSIPNLTSYDEIRKVVKTDTGENLVQLARVSHIHLFGVSLIFLLTGAIFALSGTPVWFRAVVVSVPYLAIIVDIGSWWLTRYLNPAFAYTVLVGGGATGVVLAIQILIPLWEMWIDPLKSVFAGGRGRKSPHADAVL